MKKLILLFYLFLLFDGNPSAQTIYFNKRIDITGSGEVCRSIALTKNGYMVAGGTGDEIPIIYLSNIDSLGNLKWTKTFSGISSFYYLGLSGSLFQSGDKKYAFCGGRVLSGTEAYGILIKVDTMGNKIWEKEYQLLESDYLNSGSITKDKGFILTGTAYESGLKFQYLLIKTDSLGNLKWFKTYTDNDPNRNYEGKSVVETPDKGYCIGGWGKFVNTPNWRNIVEIIKTDSLGNQQWKKTYGNPLNCNLESMISLSKDSCIFTAYSLGNSSLPEDFSQVYVTKLDLNGNEKWNKKIGNIFPNTWVSWNHSLEDGNFILSGGHRIEDTIFKYVGWLFKIKSNGDSLWYKEYTVINGPDDGNQLWQVSSTPDKGFVGAGSLFPNSSGGTQDIWVFKTDSLGCLFPGCDVGITEFNPNSGAQMLIYPNPFSNAFAINYNLPKETKKAVFELRDITGSLVFYTPLTINVNQLQVLANNLKSGIYLACLLIDNVVVSSQKVVKN